MFAISNSLGTVSSKFVTKFSSTIATTAVLLASVCSMSAYSAEFSKVYVFGDSVSDSGHGGIKSIHRVDPTDSDSPYAQVAVEVFSEFIGVDPLAPSTQGGTNYALRASTTEGMLQQYRELTQTPEPVSFAPVAFVSSNSFSASNEISASNELTVSTDFSASDFVVSDNEVFVLFGGSGEALSGGSASEAVANIMTIADDLNDRGASLVMSSTLWDYGQSPSGHAQPTWLVASPEDLLSFSQDFNGSLVAEAASSDANVLVFDLGGLINELMADPAAFGFGEDWAYYRSNTLQAASDDAAPEDYVFYDGIHFTATVHDVMGMYMASTLTASQEIGSLPTVSSELSRSAVAALQGAVESFPQGGNGLRLISYVNYSSSSQQLDFATEADANLSAIAFGVRYPLADNLSVSVMLNKGWVDLSFDETGSDFDGDNVGLSAELDYVAQDYFLNVSASFQWFDYDSLSRHIELSEDVTRIEVGATKGHSAILSVQGGYNLIDSGSLTAGPIVGVEILKSKVNGYGEAGVLSTAMFVEDQILNSQRVQLGGFVKVDNKDWAFVADVMYQRELDGSDQSITMGFNTLPDNTFDLPVVNGNRNFLQLRGGVSKIISDKVRVGFDGRYRTDFGQQDTFSAMLSLSLAI